MTQYAFYYDNSRCTGCRTCELACKDYKALSKGTAFRKTYDYEGGSWEVQENGGVTTTAYAYHVALSCNHCDSPACVEVCPTGAMHKDAGTGLVSVDASKCVGCGYCHMACPYNAPKVDREKGHSVKCDGCQDRVAEGKRPICVDACPLRALDFGLRESMAARYSDYQQANIAPLPDKSYTNPNLYIKPCPAAKPVDDTTGSIANPLEVQ